MNELLDLSKVKVEAANWYVDEESQRYVNVDQEVSKDMFERYLEIHSFIGQVQTDIKWKFLFIGWALKEMLDEKIYHYVKPAEQYKMCGYTSFYKFVSEIYHIKERTAKRMVAVAREFCRASDSTSVREDQLKDLPVCQLRLEYMNYSYSQLAELLSIEEQYRSRLPVSASVRDMQKISKLYASGYVPSEKETYKDDLEVYKRRKKEEQDKKNAKQKQINFVPAQAKVPTSAPTKSATSETVADFDDEDERDVITPAAFSKKPEYEAVRAGLLCQLSLLLETEVGVAWKRVVELFEDALINKAPFKIVSKSELVKSNLENCDLKTRIESLENGSLKAVQPATGKLSLKNQKERKDWLENYKAWGVWLDVPQVSKKYYRYDFINGASLIVEEYRFFSDYCKVSISTEVRYGIIDKDCPEFADGKVGGASGVVEWMTKHAKEI